MKDCQIQPGKRDSSKLEVKLKGTTKFLDSSKKFDVAPTEYKSLASAMEITVQQVSTLTEYERVNAKVKVLVCEKPIVFASGKTKQEVTVGDESGTACVTLWEENVDKLKQGECYQLKGFFIREYGGKKFLAFGREGSEVLPAAEQVHCSNTGFSQEAVTVLDKPVIVAVLKLINFKKCFRCQAQVEPLSPPLCRCTKAECATLQRFDICEEVRLAQLLVLGGSKMHTLRATGKKVEDVAGTDNPTEMAILKAPAIKKMTFNDKKEIVDISR